VGAWALAFWNSAQPVCNLLRGPERGPILTGRQALSYDQTGNQTKTFNGGAVTYNSFDLPKFIANSSNAGTFAYDAEGARASKTTGPASARATTLYAGGLYERRILPTGETVHVLYIPAAGRIVAQETWIEKPAGVVTRADVLHLHDDIIGSIVAVSGMNSSNNRASSYRYDPYGRRIVATNPLSPVQNPPTNFFHAASGVFFTMNLGFTGHEMDDEFGFINMKGRVYDAKLGRFLTPDPVTHIGSKAAGWDRYAYAFNNPFK
jgi:RHS repeat-associated protein